MYKMIKWIREGHYSSQWKGTCLLQIFWKPLTCITISYYFLSINMKSRALVTRPRNFVCSDLCHEMSSTYSTMHLIQNICGLILFNTYEKNTIKILQYKSPCKIMYFVSCSFKVLFLVFLRWLGHVILWKY